MTTLSTADYKLDDALSLNNLPFPDFDLSKVSHSIKDRTFKITVPSLSSEKEYHISISFTKPNYVAYITRVTVEQYENYSTTNFQVFHDNAHMLVGNEQYGRYSAKKLEELGQRVLSELPNIKVSQTLSKNILDCR
jgi:GH15 family glucan-1,4-alpha-glucosidase